MIRYIAEVLENLQELMRDNRYENLQTDKIEIKPCPSDAGQWTEIYKSVNAFLNTCVGIIILGIKETAKVGKKHYVFTGYRPE
jgi:predicted HTH transcriptional regulator